MHYKEVKGILSAKNGMNLYRGCTHGCIYCDARSTCYRMDHPVEDVEVKSNALELLEKTLKQKRKKCMISTGAMSDPYIPLEETLKHTRKSLELIEKYGFGLSIQTKSDLILRDLDLLKSINQKTKCVVQITLTTYDEKLCKLIEPNVCTTSKRYEVLKTLKEHGIPTVVWLTPILPFINDTEENLRGLLNYCIEAGVYGILTFGMGLTLREGNREYFYKMLDRHFPSLKKLYMDTYGNAYHIPSKNSALLNQILKDTCNQHGIISDDQEIFEYMSTFEDQTEDIQLNFFDCNTFRSD